MNRRALIKLVGVSSLALALPRSLSLFAQQTNPMEAKEFEVIIACVVGGCLLTGGYGSTIGASLGALIFGTVYLGIYYTNVDTDFFKVFLGTMLLLAVLFNNYVRKRITQTK